MFTFLQLCYMLFIACYIFADQGYKVLYIVFCCPYWFLEGAAHFIFAIKYWIVARKIKEINTGKVD